ncbi:MAG: hypothetical protein KBS41_01115 [Oscillospiraceae bacterium]|nr:hypothetical protein [Candidatus Equicaccousia limihippi]
MIIEKSFLQGEITPPPSKSELHRALICAALSGETSKIHNFFGCDDLLATVGALKSFGAEILVQNGTDTVNSGNIFTKNRDIITVDCGESASTLRFLIPVAAAMGKNVRFVGKPSLMARPIDEYAEIFKNHGVKISCGDNSVTVSGNLPAANSRSMRAFLRSMSRDF